MPVGVQQTLEGMVCYICSEFAEEGEQLCIECVDNYISYCNGCNEVGLNNNYMNIRQYQAARAANADIMDFSQAIDDDNLYCEDCISRCVECGECYGNSDAASECCYDYNDGVINNYSYRPNFNYYSTQNGIVGISPQQPGLLYMGVEIEINKLEPIAEDFMERMSPDSRDFVYLKEDGSIGPDGAELVTMPATIDAFVQMFPFNELDWARSMGARSFYYNNCGFHIHVARSAFTATHMWKFVKFQLNNPALCQRVAQRDESSYATWYYEDDERRSLPEYVKGK